MSQARILYVHGAGTRAAQATTNAALLRTRLGLEATPDRLAVSGVGPEPGHGRAVARDGSRPARLRSNGRSASPVPRPPRPERCPTPSPRYGRWRAARGAPRRRNLEMPMRCSPSWRSAAPTCRERACLENRLSDAARDVAASPEYAAARGDAVALIDATAMSTLARAAERDPKKAGRAGFLGLDLGWLADRAGDVAASILGGGLISMVEGWIVPQLTPALSLWASRRLAPRRRAFMHENILVVADVLRYQRHGEQIREHVRAEIRALDKPRLVDRPQPRRHHRGGRALWP